MSANLYELQPASPPLLPTESLMVRPSVSEPSLGMPSSAERRLDTAVLPVPANPPMMSAGDGFFYVSLFIVFHCSEHSSWRKSVRTHFNKPPVDAAPGTCGKMLSKASVGKKAKIAENEPGQPKTRPTGLIFTR